MRLRNCLLLFFICCVGCQTSKSRSLNGTDDIFTTIKIYHTNDIHAHLSPDAQGRGGLAYVASVLKLIRKQDGEALILDAGDFYKKGSLPSQNTKDEITADIMSHLPYYDARAVGNNEVKVGIPRLLEWVKTKEQAPLLSASFVDKDKKPVFKPWIILKKWALKIGIIGLTVKVPIEDSVQAPASDPRAPYSILDPEVAVVPYIKELRPQVDILILLSHDHYKDNLKIAKDHPEIDLVVSGHTHKLTGDQKTRNGNLVVEAGQFGQQVGAVTLYYDNTHKKVASLDSTFWPVGSDFQLADGPIAEEIREAYAKWAPDAFVRFGENAETLSIIDPSSPYEGTLDNWVADQFRIAAHSDIAIVNREMLREPLYKGPVTKEAIFLSAPYDDEVAVVTLPQNKLEKMLKENVARTLPRVEFYPFAFTGVTSNLTLTDHQFKKVSLNFEDSKKDISVALPYYMVSHCLEFFTADQCPMPEAKKIIFVRPLIENVVTKIKLVQASPANRVIVQDTQKAPPTITTDQDSDTAEGDE
jgi:5'-nucleotidase